MRVLILTFLSLFSLVAFAQNTISDYDENKIGEARKNGDILVFHEQVIDLGVIPKDSEQSLSFRFLNIGNEPIEYDFFDVCSCSEVFYEEDAKIQPGEEGIIDVIFKSAEKKGVEEPITIDMQIKNIDKKHNLPYYYTLTYIYKYEE